MATSPSGLTPGAGSVGWPGRVGELVAETEITSPLAATWLENPSGRNANPRLSSSRKPLMEPHTSFRLKTTSPVVSASKW